MKKAFTLSEMLVCISIMAVLVVLFLSTTHAKPNSNMVMFRKAYNITSTNVYEMLQSAAYYETGILKDTQKTSEKVEDEYPQGIKKFCKIFASFVNTTGDINCGKTKTKPSFVTLDGITWWLPPKTTPGTFQNPEIITIDVNGTDNLPNCKEGDNNCDNPDIFDIEINRHGKISIPGTIAQQYLQNTRKISK